MYVNQIESIVYKLPEGAQKEILNYSEFLLKKHIKNAPKNGLKFNWKGGLSELKDNFTSVSLQHKSLKWRKCF